MRRQIRAVEADHYKRLIYRSTPFVCVGAGERLCDSGHRKLGIGALAGAGQGSERSKARVPRSNRVDEFQMQGARHGILHLQ
jgi:hypothetical protein